MLPTRTQLARGALLAAIILIAPSPGVAHAQDPLTAGFDVSPAAPEPGQPVTFQSTTSGGGTGPLELAWDLDADGQFDDGATASVQRAYAAGDHVVRLRARRAGPGEPQDIAEKTVHVAVAPTPTATPIPTPTADPAANQPPVARIDPQCRPTGLGSLCSARLARVNAPKTFDATPSTDADGHIVRHEWDLDGDGSFETDTGAAAQATHSYLDMKATTIGLRVTDDRGATAATALALQKLEPACQTAMTFRRVHATGPCLRRYRVDGGDKLVLPDGTFTTGPEYTGDQYRSTLPIDLNGITVWPAKGKAIVINVLDHGNGPKLELMGQAVATIKSDGGTIKIDEKQIRWRLAGDRLLDVERPAGGSIGGLAIAGMPVAPELRLGGAARFRFLLSLPSQFGAPTSDDPVVVTTGGGTTASAAGTPLSFEVANASIGPIGLDKLVVSYDGDDFWEVEAGVTLPPPVPYTIEGSAGIRDGKFAHAGAEVSFGTPGIGPFGPVFIQRIKFRVEVEPKKSECVPGIGIVEVATIPGWKPIVIDYGVPTFALCGEVGLTAGPTILGAAALRMDAGLGFATFADRPAVLRAFGTLSVVDVPLTHATLEVHGDGYVKAEGRFKYGWDGLASVKGYLLYEMLGAKFNAEAGIDACLEFVDFCRGGKAIVSSKGIAVCIIIDYEIDDWRPGIGYRWGDSSPTLYFSGCSLGPYRARVASASAAAAGERSFEMKPGLPGAAIAVTGRDAPPKITLIGPKGERITTPDDLMPVTQRPFFVLKDPRAKLTQVAITKPSAGRWRVVTEDGSSPIVSLETADGLEAPEVHARVVGTGHRRSLAYQIDERPGQKVTFVERGASTGGAIGAVKGARGRIRFSPADGAAESREIVALVEQDGLPRDQLVVARYRAPGAARPAKPRGMRLVRRGTTVRVSWQGGAPRHVVAITLSNGRRVVEQVDGRRHVVRGVARGLRARATVRAIGANGMLGPVARKRL